MLKDLAEEASINVGFKKKWLAKVLFNSFDSFAPEKKIVYNNPEIKEGKNNVNLDRE